MRSASKKLKVVLDTKPLIKLFAGEEGWEVVKEIPSRVEAGVSVVTLTEVYYKYLQEERLDLAVARTGQLKHALYLKKLVIDEGVAVKAEEFKGRYNVSIADAFIAASAYYENATIISDDPDFKKILEIKVLTETELYHKLCAGAP
ncbi:MAG: PIN domain-containing protein [Candidatus Bathyarchaeia archaeon]